MPVGQARPMSNVFLPPQVVDSKNRLERIDSVDSIEAYKNGGVVQVEEQTEQVLGSTELYDKDGNLRLVPVCVIPFPDVMFFFRVLIYFPLRLRPRLPIPKVCFSRL